jgi:hypothetical protein
MLGAIFIKLKIANQGAAHIIDGCGGHGQKSKKRRSANTFDLHNTPARGALPTSTVVHYCPKIESARHLSRKASQFA